MPHLDFEPRFYTNPPIMVTRQALRADRVSKIVVKVVQEDFDKTCEKSYWLSFFHECFHDLSTGWYQP